MDNDSSRLEKFKEQFKKEIDGVSDINQLKEIYAREIAKRDKLIEELQQQNDVILKSAFKQRFDETKFDKQE